MSHFNTRNIPRNHQTMKKTSNKTLEPFIQSQFGKFLHPNDIRYFEQKFGKLSISRRTKFGNKSGRFAKKDCKLSNKLQQNSIQHSKSRFRSLTFSEKIKYIESLIMKLQKECKQYGYFYITEPMLQYNLDIPIIGEVTFFCQQGIFKPIHPIMKPTRVQEEYFFMHNLKKILSYFFPTIDLGTRKTLSGFLNHIKDLKSYCTQKKSEKLSSCRSVDCFQLEQQQCSKCGEVEPTLSSTIQLKQQVLNICKLTYNKSSNNILEHHQKRFSINDKYPRQNPQLNRVNKFNKKSMCDQKWSDRQCRLQQLLSRDCKDSFIYCQEQVVQSGVVQSGVVQSDKPSTNTMLDERASGLIEKELDSLFMSSMDMKASGLYNSNQVETKDALNRLQKVAQDFQQLF